MDGVDLPKVAKQRSVILRSQPTFIKEIDPRVDDSTEKLSSIFSAAPDEFIVVEEGHAVNISSRKISTRSRAYQSCHTIRTIVFTVYRRLFTVIFAANLIALLIVVIRARDASRPSLDLMANLAVANLNVAVLIRQDYIRNLLFSTCWSCPHFAPLWLRSRLARVYENGGVHSGGAVCAVAWSVALVSYLTLDMLRSPHEDMRVSIALLSLCYAFLGILTTIALLAIPQVRDRHHNLFENTHRLGGWACILLFWPILVLFVQSTISTNMGTTLSHELALSPALWLLIIVTAHVIRPWISLREVPVIKVERLSANAIRLYFSPKEIIPPLYGLVISDAALREWHSFAAIPDLDGTDGGASSCIISRAGDWTAKTIESPARSYYMRGRHMTGALHMAKIFKRVVIMATGSGVGPCLALFGNAPGTKIRFIWSAPSPETTYGDKIIRRVLAEDEEAVIWDTRIEGQKRPDLVRMAHELYVEMDAEAVFFISNKRLTRSVVRGLRLLGVPTYAPVFDS